MTLHWPQVTILILQLLSLGIALGRSGQSKNQNYNFFTELFNVGITQGLLFLGGFYK